MSCWTLVESTVYKVNWLNLGEPKVQVQLPWSQIYHFMTDTTYSSSGRRRMIHEPSSHSCIFWPINYSSPLVHSTYFSLATILLSSFFTCSCGHLGACKVDPFTEEQKRTKCMCTGCESGPTTYESSFFFYHVTLEDNFKDFATVFHMRVQHSPSVHAQKQNPVISGCTQNENEHRWDWLEEMWLSLANERVMTLTQAATCVTGLFPLSHLHSREPWI